MGLYIHSLAELPVEAMRSYYVYLLDYGWEESLGDAVRKNIPKMADLASKSDAVVIYGPRGLHFEDEVLSWHNVNGERGEDILPAILLRRDIRERSVNHMGSDFSSKITKTPCFWFHSGISARLRMM